MSNLTLDRTDGGVDALVSEWKVGGTYELRVKVKQTGATPEAATFDVIEATDETAEAEPEAVAIPPKAAKPVVTVAK